MPDPLERRHLGSTAVEVTRLGLGCAPLGNLYDAISDADAASAVDAAWDHGLRFFDTAPLYGHGLSELRLGAGLAGRDRSGMTVATKVGRLLVPDDPSRPADTIFADVPPVHPEFDFSADGALRSLEASLERLQLDRVDVLHVHDPDDHLDEALAGAFPALRRLRDEGVVGAIGAGMNQSEALVRIVREADVDCVLLAGRYTLLDHSGADELLPLCADRNVSVIAAGVFNSGLLADPDAPNATYDYAAAPPAVVQRARELARICADHDTPLRAAALQFPLRHPAVTCVIVGARTKSELDDNVALFRREIPEDLWSVLGEELPEH
ncbi:MAG: aldo/keto reductase [Actinobacteria bacterium]|nr:aldo/keto reductase [Actinomycetota bacterium]MBV9933298.1 aldo/keto reductase [Actinomycetota bacterium]